jgi:hypothetical protein
MTNDKPTCIAYYLIQRKIDIYYEHQVIQFFIYIYIYILILSPEITRARQNTLP